MNSQVSLFAKFDEQVHFCLLNTGSAIGMMRDVGIHHRPKHGGLLLALDAVFILCVLHF